MCIKCSQCDHCKALVTACVAEACCEKCTHEEWQLSGEGAQIKPLRAELAYVRAEVTDLAALDLAGQRAQADTETRLRALADRLAGDT